jgi:hypothetical protein
MSCKTLCVGLAIIFAAMTSSCLRADEANRNPLVIGVASVQPDVSYRDTILALHAVSHDPLNNTQLLEFKKLVIQKGWPPVMSVGPEAVNAVGDMALWSSSDYALQQALEQVIYSRVGIDVNGLAFAYLNDQVEIKHTGWQQYGVFLSLKNGRVQMEPPVDINAANMTRDLTGLPTVAEYEADVQKQVDQGTPLKKSMTPPQLASEPRTYSQPELRIQLGKMIDADQDVRRTLALEGKAPKKSSLDNLKRIDAENLIALKGIFKKVGFPTVAMVGRDGVSTAFLLVQHADADPAFQRHALTLAEPLALRRELPRREFAMLTDRVLIAEGKQQLYGTQATIERGHVQLLPVVEPSDLDHRRAAMTMGPEQDYLKALEQLGK